MSERFNMSIEPMPTTPTAERMLREEAFVMPVRNLDPKDMFRCPGCDCEPVGYAPHNGLGDCPPKGADRTDGSSDGPR